MNKSAGTPPVRYRRTWAKELLSSPYLLWADDVSKLIQHLPEKSLFDLVVTSPPYNIGKAYEKRQRLRNYLEWQEEIITSVIKRLKPSGSICWQVGNYIDNGHIVPLDIELHPIFRDQGLKLRNRIIWHFGHGLHTSQRFSGRYEVILWYTKGDAYHFDLDAVRVPSKYPAKKYYKGPKKGQFSGNPSGKNPEDVWKFENEDVWDNIPNVKGNHVEKTDHPCQFPIGLVERLVLALTKPNALVFDPYCGVGSAGAAAALHNRRFWGADPVRDYLDIAKQRITDALSGSLRYRPHDKALYDYRQSPLSKFPLREIES